MFFGNNRNAILNHFYIYLFIYIINSLFTFYHDLFTCKFFHCNLRRLFVLRIKQLNIARK